MALFILNHFLPGLVWTKSLRVSYSDEDFNSVEAKMDTLKDIFPSEEDKENYDYVYGELTKITLEFTEAELTALLNESNNEEAVDNFEVKFNNDDTITLSAKLNIDYLLNSIGGGEISRSGLQEQMPAMALLPGSANIYTNLTLEIINNNVEFNVNDLNVQGIPLLAFIDPEEVAGQLEGGLETIIEGYVDETGATFESVKIEEDKLIFEGMFPEFISKTEKK